MLWWRRWRTSNLRPWERRERICHGWGLTWWRTENIPSVHGLSLDVRLAWLLEMRGRIGDMVGATAVGVWLHNVHWGVRMLLHLYRHWTRWRRRCMCCVCTMVVVEFCDVRLYDFLFPFLRNSVSIQSVDPPSTLSEKGSKTGSYSQPANLPTHLPERHTLQTRP